MLPPNSVVYQQRHVLFCDILGFSVAVRDGTVPPQSILALLRKLKEVEQQANDPIDPEAVEPETDRRPDYVVQPLATYFSDCIAVSVPATNVDAIWLCELAAEMQRLLVGAGFLCRGAICTGLLYHDADLLFGPAFIRAVEQEKATEYPRIAVDQQTVEHFRSADTDLDREIAQIRENQLLVHDGDITYVDPFYLLKSHTRSSTAPQHFPGALIEVRVWHQVVCKGLKTAVGKTRAKYVWAAKDFNRRMSPDGSWVPKIEVPTDNAGWFVRLYRGIMNHLWKALPWTSSARP